MESIHIINMWDVGIANESKKQREHIGIFFYYIYAHFHILFCILSRTIEILQQIHFFGEQLEA